MFKPIFFAFLVVFVFVSPASVLCHPTSVCVCGLLRVCFRRVWFGRVTTVTTSLQQRYRKREREREKREREERERRERERREREREERERGREREKGERRERREIERERE